MKTSYFSKTARWGGTLTSIGAFPNIVKIATEKSEISGRKIRSVDSKGQQLSGSLWDNIQINDQELKFTEDYCFYYGRGNDRSSQTVNIIGLPKKGIGRNQCNGKEREQQKALVGKSYVEINVEIPIGETEEQKKDLLVWGTGNPKEDGKVLGCIDTKWWREKGHRDNNGIIVWDSFLKNGEEGCAHRVYVGQIVTDLIKTENKFKYFADKWGKVNSGGWHL